MTIKQVSKTWREKTPAEMRKSDFVYAVKANPDYRREPLLKDVAFALADHWSPEHKVIWASIRRFAYLLHMDEGKISMRIQRLIRDGAVKEIAREDVSDAVLALCAGKDKRGKFFTINFMWAFELAERLNKPAFSRQSEPSQLRKSKARLKKGHYDSNLSGKVTMTVTDKVTVTVTQQGHCDSETKQEYLTGEEHKRALREKKAPLRAHQREEAYSGNSYALAKDGLDPDRPLPIPANDDEGHAVLDDLLSGCEVVDAVRNYFHVKLMHGELTLAMLVEYRRAAA